METFILLLILCAALLHAVWNALVKSGGDPWLRMGIVMGSGSLLCLIGLPFVSFPEPQVWPYIVASVIVHQIYFTGVCIGYKLGDLSHVYPIQRGMAPILVALGAWFYAGETLSIQGMFGVGLISLAILSLTIGTTRFPEDGKALICALFTGVAIAVYTIIDGLGARLSSDVYGYIIWLFLLSGLPYGLLALRLLWKRPGISDKKHIFRGSIGGVLSMTAYGLAIWAMTIVPMTYVSALRETSVIFAAIIGTRLMNEPFGKSRIAAASLVAAGVYVLQTGGAI